MPTYGTKVPCEEQICALPKAIIKGKQICMHILF